MPTGASTQLKDNAKPTGASTQLEDNNNLQVRAHNCHIGQSKVYRCEQKSIIEDNHKPTDANTQLSND